MFSLRPKNLSISWEASTRRKTTKGTQGLGVKRRCYLYVDRAYCHAGEDAYISLNHATTLFNHEGSKIVHFGWCERVFTGSDAWCRKWSHDLLAR